jgi:hypothetical protein
MVAREVGNLEEAMELRILPRKSVAAIAGAVMLAASSGSSPAFTLSAPSLERPVAAADVESVYWRAGWHGDGTEGGMAAGIAGAGARAGVGVRAGVTDGAHAIMASGRPIAAGGPHGVSAAVGGSEARRLG